MAEVSDKAKIYPNLAYFRPVADAQLRCAPIWHRSRQRLEAFV